MLICKVFYSSIKVFVLLQVLSSETRMQSLIEETTKYQFNKIIYLCKRENS